MGNTIRREPVSYKIPDYPDYKYLNITNFKGIQQADNPFILDPSSASDALNVYVDETNTLTTRPRLKKIIKANPGLTECWGVYSLSKGYLVHGKSNDNVVMYIVSADKTHTQENITGEIPTGKRLSVFEQDNKIYIIDGNGYRFIDKTVSEKVCKNVEDVYIPTVTTDGTAAGPGTGYERYNLLTNKYKDAYRWDGTWTIDDENTENKAYKLKSIAISQRQDDMGKTLGSYIKYIPARNDGENKAFFVNYDGDFSYGRELILLDPSGKLVKHIPVNTPPQTSRITFLTVSPDLNAILYRYQPDIDNTSWYVGKTENSNNEQLENGVIDYKYYSFKLADNFWSEDREHKINNDGSCVLFKEESKHQTSGTNYTHGRFMVYRYNAENKTYVEKFIDLKSTFNDVTDNSSNIELVTSDNCNMAILYNTTSTVGKQKLLVCSNLLQDPNADLKTETLSYTNYVDSCVVNSSGTAFAVIRTNEQSNLVIDYYNNLTTLTDFRTLETDIPRGYLAEAVFSKDGDKLFFTIQDKTETDGTTSLNWVNLSNMTLIRMKNTSPIKNWQPDSDEMYATSDSFEFVQEANRAYVSIEFDFKSLEPNVFVTKELTKDDDNYSELLEKREQFLKATLTTRFQNERWFAANNVLFRTSNNDPTYITDYNTCGEDEPITGFNIIYDDLMIAYKDNKMWAISFDNDTGLFYYSETKNTVGNNAIGASIVSVYSELPLQIAYDGIYALKQVSNIQAPNRISEIISEPITKKWLREKKEDIRNCKTVNRQYWTYFIIKNKVYLLDNRSLTWYYLEFPVEILDAMTKEDVVEGDELKTIHVIFADIYGNIYVLKNDDIQNKYNPNLTEYYDEWYDDKTNKEIPWFWRSQILSLGTMNYKKKLLTTTFIVTDTDTTDEYGLLYKFRIYRKAINETKPDLITDRLNYVQTVTKRTSILRFNFLQLELSNIENDLDNNKLRLVGLGLKYEILGGLT